MMRKWFWIFFTLLLVTASILFYIVALGVESDHYRILSRKIVHYYQKLLHDHTAQALMVAITLAQNSALKEALKEIDEDRGHEILANSLGYLHRYIQLDDLRAQIIAKDLTIFARSWDQEYVGMPIEGFRKDLSNFKIVHPKVGIETGRLLTIKATAPIKDGYKIIGYLEVISFFEPLTDRLREHGIELFVLMDGSYLEVATLMRENPSVHGFVVANRNYNAPLLKRLEAIQWQELQREGFTFDGNYLFIMAPMHSSTQERIGIVVLAIHRERADELARFQENLAFFLELDREDFYDLINLWRRPEANFNSVYDRSVLEFLAKSEDPELKREFEIEARAILREYDKEQLIDIILDKFRREKKEGVIQ
ncbi:MAG: hypothetical protein C6I00_05530 [Nitratiruptor sp.]|nr:hypothetical protein [Nitratiruptor sp.]NPA83561.1 hypothetical protein [Campylobacterota bacterium]